MDVVNVECYTPSPHLLHQNEGSPSTPLLDSYSSGSSGASSKSAVSINSSKDKVNEGV